MYSFIISMVTLWDLANYDLKTQEILKWVANCFMYVSAIALSVSISVSLLPITYAGFLLAHVIWAFIALKLKDSALFWQFAFFIPFDLYAMYIRL